MAEGLQRRIEYSDLKFISSFAMEKILDFQTWEVPGEHARGNFRLLLSENETGINSMNTAFGVGEYCGNTVQRISGKGGNQRRKRIQDCRHTGCVRNNSFRSEKK